uniref:Uncharacterized protein n=1 Tax=Rhizophora mucronata TaxID=61149 RepID=A0A2P2PQH5_RHIMU
MGPEPLPCRTRSIISCSCLLNKA